MRVVGDLLGEPLRVSKGDIFVVRLSGGGFAAVAWRWWCAGRLGGDQMAMVFCGRCEEALHGAGSAERRPRSEMGTR